MVAIHVVRLDESRHLEAGEGRVHAEVEPRYEEVVGVVISANERKLLEQCAGRPFRLCQTSR